MSQYNEIIGSFVRTGNFPIEANYIFNSEEELKEFYNQEINNTTLHKGLLKIVASEDSQILYWVVQVDGELQFKQLIQEGSIDKLFDRATQIRNDLNQEISDRKNDIINIVGTNDISEFQNQLNNLLKISNAVVSLQSQADQCSKVIHEIVGTDEDNILEYLKSLDYSNLSQISDLLNRFFNTIDEQNTQINTFPELQEFLRGFDHSHSLQQHLKDLTDKIYGDPIPNSKFRTLRGIQDFVEILSSLSNNRYNNLQTELNQTQVGIGLSQDGSFSPDQETIYLKNATSVMNALKTLDGLISRTVKAKNITSLDTPSTATKIEESDTEMTISSDVKISNGSDIIINDDGLYTKLSTEYIDGVLTIKVNGNIRSQHMLAISSIIDNAYYNPDIESLVINFKDSQEVTIPVDSLIEEWDVDNPDDKVIQLSKERIVTGTDKLSADVRLDPSTNNILKKSGNALIVDGRSSNITHNEETLSSVLQQIQTTNSSLSNNIQNLESNLQSEINRATTAENSITNTLITTLAEYATKQEVQNKIATVEESLATASTEILRISNNITEINNSISEIDWYEG